MFKCILIPLNIIFFSALLVVDQSKGSVYAYYAIRTVSYIISQGSIFCIAVAYAVSHLLLLSLDMNWRCNNYFLTNSLLFRQMLLMTVRGLLPLVG